MIARRFSLPRRFIQALYPVEAYRSTIYDTSTCPLASSRQAVLKATISALMRPAEAVLPDRLAGVPGLEARRVRAIDGPYRHESVRYRRRTPSEGGKNNHKGHALETEEKQKGQVFSFAFLPESRGLA